MNNIGATGPIGPIAIKTQGSIGPTGTIGFQRIQGILEEIPLVNWGVTGPSKPSKVENIYRTGKLSPETFADEVLYMVANNTPMAAKRIIAAMIRDRDERQ